MLLLFVVNELSYDKHFANNERIVRLVSSWEQNGKVENLPINLRKAYTELPAKIPGIESAVQIYNGWRVEIVVDQNRFQNQKMLYVDPEFFEVFKMKFIEGVPANALKEPNSIVITRRLAKIIFGNETEVAGRPISIFEREYIVSAVVEELPLNTHFTFDFLLKMEDNMSEYGGLEFHTFYLIQPEASLENVCEAIKTEYTAMMSRFPPDWKGAGFTEKLTDIYLSTKANTLGKAQKMDTIWLLSAIALFILLLAISNFINMFMTHGETRMKEIGIRKANGAGIGDIIRQFFVEVSIIVFVAFVLGLWLSIILTPYFSKLINAEVALTQLMTPTFIISMIVLYVLTVTLSAGYPSFYLSRFSPLDILFKRIKFSKRRLTASVVVFQSIVTLVLISSMITIYKQTKYLENLPKGYNTENVAAMYLNGTLNGQYSVIKQEFLNIPDVQQVSSANHLIGRSGSGQSIALLEDKTKSFLISEYRIAPGMCELMEFQLLEGEFFKDEHRGDTIRRVILNEAAVRMLRLEQPVVGKNIDYCGIISQIIGVVKDFCYAEPSNEIQPLILTFSWGYEMVYFKFDKNLSRLKIMELFQTVFNKFDPNFVPDPVWLDDIYTKKFASIKTQAKIIFYSTLLSIFIAMLGLFAIHLYASMRRTKEIGIRKIHGAGPKSIFLLLSADTLKWIVIAAVIAIPVEYYVVSQWLENYTVRISLGGSMFIFPILIQCAIALTISFGLTVRVLSQNPVNALKSE
jgi:putative ABC transport system permease protein